MTHSLTLGGLLLTRSFPDAEHGYVFDVLAEGVGFGVAAGVQEVVTSLLADGDLVRTSRYGNREVTFAVEITGPTLAALAHGEAALRREVGRSNTLTWQAPDVLSVPTVFEVVTSEMSQTFNDLDELKRRRTFKVTLTCAPFARSAEKTTVAAYTSGVTTVSVDACSSATNWTGTRSGASWPVSDTWEAGSVTVVEVDSATTSPETWTLTRTGSVDFTTTPYLVVEVKTLSFQQGVRVSVTAGGVSLPLLANRMLADGSTYSRLTFDASGLGVVSAITFSHDSLPGESIQGLFVRQVSRSDIPPNVTSRQLTRIVHAGGTERTPCSLEVTPGAFEALGVGIVHTSPEEGAGYSPALRQYRVSGNPVTTDATLLSGGMEAITPNPIVSQVPLTALAEDTFAIAAFMKSSKVGTYSFTWQARTIVGSSYLGGHEGTTEARFFDVGTWTLVPLALVTLPPVRATEGGVVQFNLTRTVVDEEIYLDEWWAFRMGDDCALTIVQAFDASFLWLDSADSTSSVPRVWVGGNSDRSDQFHPGANGLIAQGNHVLRPDGTAVFVAASKIEFPGFEVSYHKRWHSNAAE